MGLKSAGVWEDAIVKALGYGIIIYLCEGVIGTKKIVNAECWCSSSFSVFEEKETMKGEMENQNVGFTYTGKDRAALGRKGRI